MDGNGFEKELVPIIFWDEGVTKGDLSGRQASYRGEALSKLGQPALEKDPASVKEKEVSPDFQQSWSIAIHRQSHALDSLAEVLAGVANFLQKNPAPAFDQRLANMILYFLKNYINNNPDLVDRPFSERLEDACEMARQFIRTTNASQAPPVKDSE